jgi:uncharacterized protein (UPF0147 family)
MQNATEGLEAALEKLTSSQEDFYKGQLALTRVIGEASAPGNDAKRAEVARKLAEALVNGGKYPIAARREIARRLGEIGGDSEIPALQSALVDLELRESARGALDRIPTPAATAALVQASKQLLGDRFVIGIVNALGQRSGEGVVAALSDLAKSPNAEIRVAVGEALSQQSDPSGDEIILAIINDKSVPLNPQEAGRLAKARVRLAANMGAKDKKADARRIFESIVSKDPNSTHGLVAKRMLAAL